MIKYQGKYPVLVEVVSLATTYHCSTRLRGRACSRSRGRGRVEVLGCTPLLPCGWSFLEEITAVEESED